MKKFLPTFSLFISPPPSIQILLIQILPLLPALRPLGLRVWIRGRTRSQGAASSFIRATRTNEGRLAESTLPERAITLWPAFLSSGAVSVAQWCLRLGCKLCCSRSWFDLKEVCGQCGESYRRKGEAKPRQRAKVEGGGGGQGRCSPLAPPGRIFTPPPRRSLELREGEEGNFSLICFSSAPLYWWEAGRVPGLLCLLGIVVLPSSSGPPSCPRCPGSWWVRIRSFLSCPSSVFAIFCCGRDNIL